MPSGADLEYQRMLANAGVDPNNAQGYDAARLEQLGDELGFSNEVAKAKEQIEGGLAEDIANPVTPVGTALLASYVGKALPASAVAAEAAGLFDPRLSVYNWKPSNTRRFRTAWAKALVGAGVCDIVYCGESTIAGHGLTDTNKATPAVVRDTLAARGIPLAGNGATYIGRGNDAVIDAYATQSGAWGHSGEGRFLGRYTTIAGASWTVTGVGTVMRFVTRNNPSAALTYTIDGGAPVAWTSDGTLSLEVVEVTGLTDAAHSITVTCDSEGSRVDLYSVEFRKTAGVSITNAGASGSFAAFWSEASQPDAARNQYVVTARGYPDLTLFGLGINDLSFFVDVATFKARVLAAVSQLTNAHTRDLVLFTSNAAQGDWTAPQFAAYLTAFYEIADELDVPLLDINNRFPSFDEVWANGLMLDFYHPAASYCAERAVGCDVPALLGA